MTKLTFDKTFCSPEAILECGQIFRFSPFAEGYFVVSRDKAAYIYEKGPDTVIECEDGDYFFNFFDLGRDYGKIYKDVLSFGIPAVTEAAKTARGIRILNQDGEETMYSFIISQNNNIPRIKKIIERICDALGENREFLGRKYRAFPTSSELAGKDAAFYRSLGAGYRDEFLAKTALRVSREGLGGLDDLATPELKKELATYPGIGPKVADCVALFGFHRTDSFPVDTWMEKVYREDFHGKLTDRKKINEYFTEVFGNLSGIVQQYLFYAKRGM
ncbi:MAG: 8-oxoguanine DNA glycosylase [Clostridia bacterium]|nr:8-oxoguanine DNA glycosylase [Clostridia bacterium]